MTAMPPNKSLHGPTGACHGSCSKGNGRARRAIARELKRYTPPKHFLDAGPRTLT
jgi:hypothetical protein